MTAQIFRRMMIAVLAIFCIGASGSAHDLDPEAVKRLALEAILENPEIVMEAVQLLERREAAERERQAASALVAERRRLENDPNAPVVGNPMGSVTVVEFFDYNCPYCRRAKVQLDAVLRSDDDVRVVLREWPILGEESVFAARAALAARKQDKYVVFHDALMALRGRANEASVMQVARQVGLDVAQLRTDMDAPEIDAHIDASMELARSIGFSGTPSFVVGDTLVPGFIEADAMSAHIEKAREGS
ncbi:MAG: DsbA family protein [Pseudomonadota bacterium]